MYTGPRIELVRFEWSTRQFGIARCQTQDHCIAVGLEFTPDDRPGSETMAFVGLATDNTLYPMMSHYTGVPTAELRSLGPDLGFDPELHRRGRGR